MGWVALNGSPVGQGIRLKLEDQSYTPVAEATTDANGVYTFLDLDPSEQGYNVLFAQEWNQNFEIDQVISWGWMGPVVVQAGSALELPDFEISPLGFKQVSPESNSTFSAAAISAANPIRFEWSAYPQAATYWVDLARGEEQPVLWQSLLVEAGPVEFDGTLSDSSHIQPGDYWWGVGARRPVEAYIVTVYGLQQRLTIEP